MSADEFDRRKTGRFALPTPPAPRSEDEEEDTQTREHPAGVASPGPEDPAFEKRKTQIFRRPALPETAPDEAEDDEEHGTGEYERVKTGLYRRRDVDSDPG